MRTIAYTRYGGPEVLAPSEAERPVPADGEVLVRVRAASVNAGDHHLLHGTPWPMRLMFGLRRPKLRVLGSAVSGTVEAIGAGVEGFRPGDAVLGDLSGCGFGGFAEYACGPARFFCAKPESVGFDVAATLPVAAVTALQALRDHGGLQAGQRVLVNGAAGGVGSFAVQIAVALGAEVTAVCGTAKVEAVRALGAARVIDRGVADVTAAAPRHDLMIDAAAFRPVAESLTALVPGGRYVLVGGLFANTLRVALLGRWIARRSGRVVTTLLAKPDAGDLAEVAALVARGAVRPLIDARFPLEGVPDALRRLEARSVTGKLVIEVA